MSAQRSSSVHSDPGEAAAAWLVRIETPEATEADWAAFETWLGHPDNKRALDELEAKIAVLEDHHADRAGQDRKAPDNLLRLSDTRFARPALFAAIAAAAAAVVFLQLLPPPAEQFFYAAPAEAIRIVSLPDASRITLNRGATIRVRWSSAERRVDLQRGEAAFNVVHNAVSPFIVGAGTQTIRDIGTEFDLLREEHALTVTVRTGAVSLTAAGNPTFLVQGDQARVVGNEVVIRRVNAEDTLAWRQGQLVYHNTPLSEVVADLNRYSTIPITIGDTAAATLRFSGVLAIDRPNIMTTQLEAFLPVHSEQNAAGIVLRSR